MDGKGLLLLIAVDRIKIFDNDDQATKRYRCLPL